MIIFFIIYRPLKNGVIKVGLENAHKNSMQDFLCYDFEGYFDRFIISPLQAISFERLGNSNLRLGLTTRFNEHIP